jgi:hypothetical protein
VKERLGRSLQHKRAQCSPRNPKFHSSAPKRQLEESRKRVGHSLLQEIVLTQYRSQYNNSRIHRNGQHLRTNSMSSLQDLENDAEYAYRAVFS